MNSHDVENGVIRPPQCKEANNCQGLLPSEETDAPIVASEWNEQEFWAYWHEPPDNGSGISYWQRLFQNGPKDYDDPYYDEFDDMLGFEWRKFLGVPPKGATRLRSSG